MKLIQNYSDPFSQFSLVCFEYKERIYNLAKPSKNTPMYKSNYNYFHLIKDNFIEVTKNLQLC